MASRHNEVTLLLDALKTGLDNRFKTIESYVLQSEATILDPRFKKKGFKFAHNYDVAQQRLRGKLAAIRNEAILTDNQVVTVHPSQPSTSQDTSIWHDFDIEIAQIIPENPTAASIRELDRYIQEDYIPRTQDPLAWWNERKTVYPIYCTVT